ncbi:MAG: glycolate oxidase subunit GlcF [Alphaproteobacteria bacterium]|nr:glycolate oxidase subunit GlcF [Alphaproteobacteria bacterium]
MQTNFSSTLLSDPNIADANEILRSCVHCGFCTATCPTYALLGDELDGPRGRIYLIKDMLEQDRPASDTDVLHVDRCLSCLSCLTTCPSGVNYMHLVDHGRRHIEKTYRRKFIDRLLRSVLGWVLPDGKRFRGAQFAAKFVCPIVNFLPTQLQKMVRLAQRRNVIDKVVTPQLHKAIDDRKYHVALLTGCVQDNLDAAINLATIRLLTRHGCDVEVLSEVGCCGSINHHLGQEKLALAAVRTNVAAWASSDKQNPFDAIIANTSGCGTMLKDYGFLLRNDSEHADNAAHIASLACDITEFMSRIDLGESVQVTSMKVAYQSPCSMQHGQKITKQPVDLLRNAGFEVVEPTGGHLCCGSAGVYNVLQTDIAGKLRTQKIASLSALSPDIIASGNIGCMTQLDQVGTNDMPCPIVHTVELLDWATGGPVPPMMTEMMAPRS